MSQHIDPTPKQTDLQTLSDSMTQLMSGSYTDVTSSHTYSAVRFSKVGGCVTVKLNGLVSISSGALTNICSIPEGYRPKVTYQTDHYVAGTKLRISAGSGIIDVYNYSSSAFSDNNAMFSFTYAGGDT